MATATTARDLVAADLPWVHRLNQANGEALSFMAAEDFAAMAERARFARVIAPEAAFLLAFDQAPTDESPNFDWFKAAWGDGFLYLDRVAVDGRHRRQGLADRLYGDLAAFARAAGYRRIGCEVNIDPPNPASEAFHARQGFRPVGEARLESRGKTVRYFALDL